MLEPRIIYDDDSLFVVEKPSGWITDSANTTKNQPVIQEWVAEKFNSETGRGFQISNFKLMRNGIVHRLDKETSGLLLVAKTKMAFEDLQRQFKERLVKKTYIALVHGEIREKEGIINEPVGRLPWRRDRFGVLPGGREAVTLYKVTDVYSLQSTVYSLLELKPKTGRTHQIRIHLKHIGHPIVSDEFYAGRKTARHDKKWCQRLFLHAGGISLIHPLTHKNISFSSELSEDLLKALANLVKIS